MEQLSFWTPVYGESTCMGMAEGYFDIGSEAASIVAVRPNGEEVVRLHAKDGGCFTTMLKIVSYITVVFPIIMLIIKFICRLSHTFVVETSQKIVQLEMEAGIVITPEIEKRVEELIQQGYKGSTSLNPNIPKWVILDRSIARWEEFWRVVKENHLNTIVVPHAKGMLSKSGVKWVMEEDVTNPHSGVSLGGSWWKCGLGQVAKDLTTFVIKTGLQPHKATMEIIPPTDPKGSMRVLVDAYREWFVSKEPAAIKESIKILISSVDSNDIDIILAEALKHGIRIPSNVVREIKKCRIETERFVQFYKEKGIIEDPNALVEIDVKQFTSSFKFSYFDEAQLEEIAKKFIEQINQGILGQQKARNKMVAHDLDEKVYFIGCTRSARINLTDLIPNVKLREEFYHYFCNALVESKVIFRWEFIRPAQGLTEVRVSL